jgi:hypothetical protein
MGTNNIAAVGICQTVTRGDTIVIPPS